MTEINLLDFTDRTVPVPGMRERPNLTATAARLDEAALEKLKTAEKITGSNDTFQEILVALAIKGGLATEVIESFGGMGGVDLAFHRRDAEGKELSKKLEKLLCLRNSTQEAGSNVATRLVEARKETIRANEKGLGDFREDGPFAGKSDHSLWDMLDDYQFSNRGLDLKTAGIYLSNFESEINVQAHEALKVIQIEKEEAKRAVFAVEANATRDRILGPLAEVLREKADRSRSTDDISGADYVAQK